MPSPQEASWALLVYKHTTRITRALELHAKDLDLYSIGLHLNVTRERARQMIMKGARQARKHSS